MTRLINKKNLVLLILMLSMIFASSCTATEKPEGTSSNLPPVQGEQIEASDYSNKENWSNLPDGEVTEVDVFCLYPTSYDGADGKVATIDNKVMREGADGFIKEKASAFETSGNIYAPYYRQLDASWFLTLPKKEQEQYLKGTPLADVNAAFDYYIQNYNNEKPFILVGHSQGASMTKALMETYLKDNPQIMDRMVAAYIIGYYVTGGEIKENEHWKFAEGENDTGVIISYNTVSPDTDLSKLTVWHKGAISINPISWTRGDEAAPAKNNLGSYVKIDDEYTKVKDLANAIVDPQNGVIICDSLTKKQQREYAMPESTEAIFSNGSYHGNDISFYYYNLRENAEKRIKSFFETNTKDN